MIRIKRLALAIVLFSVFSPSPAISKIIYSGRLDLNGPDLNIDVNNDGSNDFVTGWRTWVVGNGYSLAGFDAEMVSNVLFINTELVDHDGFPGVKAPLDYGELIGPIPPQGLLWGWNSNSPMLWTETDMANETWTTYSGEWYRVNNKYLGLEISVDSDTLYGWVRLDTDAFNNIRLVDYAYENVSGTPISAGAGSEVIVALDVAPNPEWSGTITSDHPGINCPTACQESFDPGTSVSLTAIPSAGWVFEYWSDGLNQDDDPSITVIMDSEKTITAQFRPYVFPSTGITINGSSGPLTVKRLSPLFVSVSLDPGEMAGEIADWWIYMDTPRGSYSYVKGKKEHGRWLPGIHPYGQLTLQDLTTELCKMRLGKGNYVFHFAVDNNADGLFDGTWFASYGGHGCQRPSENA